MSQRSTIVKVGLDVHASQTYAAVLDPASGEVSTCRLRGAPRVALDLLASLGPGATAVYEAGPTDFVLARAAHERGIDLRVVSPGQLPRNPSDRVKTDRRDAIRLARLLAAGELTFCRVPSLEEERFRDLVRAREDVRGDLMRARHRLSKFLLRQELAYPGPGNPWTQAHRRWLGQLRFDDPASRATFVDYLVSVDALLERRSALEQALAELAPHSPFAQEVARFRCFRGIDTLSACGLAAEVGDFHRFAHPRLLSGYLGSSPARGPRTTSAGKAGSPRPALDMPAGSWSRPRTTTGTPPPSVSSSPAASKARIRASVRSPGKRSGACTPAGARFTAGAASPPESSPSPAPASSPLPLGSGHARLNRKRCEREDAAGASGTAGPSHVARRRQSATRLWAAGTLHAGGARS
jgi:transposase